MEETKIVTEQNVNTAREPVKTGDWVLTLLIAAIPLVGFIMLFVWGFGSETHPSKANWAKATLIWFAIILVLSVLLFMVAGFAIFSAAWSG